MTPKQLRRWRKSRHWTIKEAAAWAGTSYESWKSYEYGTRPVRAWLPKMIAMQKQLDTLSKGG